MFEVEKVASQVVSRILCNWWRNLPVSVVAVLLSSIVNSRLKFKKKNLAQQHFSQAAHIWNVLLQHKNIIGVGI